MTFDRDLTIYSIRISIQTLESLAQKMSFYLYSNYYTVQTYFCLKVRSLDDKNGKPVVYISKNKNGKPVVYFIGLHQFISKFRVKINSF